MGCKKIFDFSPKSFSLSVFKMAGNFGIGEIQCHDHVISTKFSESPVTELVNQKRKDNSRQAEDHIFYQPHVHPLWFIMFEDSTKKTTHPPAPTAGKVVSDEFREMRHPAIVQVVLHLPRACEVLRGDGITPFWISFCLDFFFFGAANGLSAILLAARARGLRRCGVPLRSRPLAVLINMGFPEHSTRAAPQAPCYGS